MFEWSASRTAHFNPSPCFSPFSVSLWFPGIVTILLKTSSNLINTFWACQCSTSTSTHKSLAVRKNNFITIVSTIQVGTIPSICRTKHFTPFTSTIEWVKWEKHRKKWRRLVQCSVNKSIYFTTRGVHLPFYLSTSFTILYPHHLCFDLQFTFCCLLPALMIWHWYTTQTLQYIQNTVLCC